MDPNRVVVIEGSQFTLGELKALAEADATIPQPERPQYVMIVLKLFELLEEHAVRLGPEAIEDELRHASKIWKTHRPS